MLFKRTDSLVVSAPKDPALDHSSGHLEDFPDSNAHRFQQTSGPSSRFGHPPVCESELSRKKKQKIPDRLLQSLRRSRKPANVQPPREESLKTSKSGMPKQSLSRRFKSMVSSKVLPTFECKVCLTDYREDKKRSIGNCGHTFCEHCLHNYVIYKVNRFEEVYCPDNLCESVLDPRGVFYKEVPFEIRGKYEKLHLFYAAAKDDNLKLCPQQHCPDGVLRLDACPLQCDRCFKVFCKECCLPSHEGGCADQSLDFYDKSLHYRRCKKCETVIEKNRGCNHMTCTCGHDFCYLCGEPWHYSHVCRQHEQGLAIFKEQGMCFWLCCCRCSYIRDEHSQAGLAAKLLCSPCILVCWSLVCLGSVLKLIVVTVLLLVVSVVSGVLVYTCQLICLSEKVWLQLLLLVLLPVSIVLGIGRACKDIMGKIVGEMAADTWELLLSCPLCLS